MERYTECPIGEISQIALQGSGDYEINVEDASILNINYSQNTLTINPIAKGITKISVYDKITKNIANSTVKITDAYCTFQVGNPVRPPFSSSVYVYMVYNCTNDLYMFDNNFNLIEKGHYLFEKTNEKYSLTFSLTLSKILCKWKQDSVVSLFLYLNSVFKHKHKLIHNQAPV